MSSLDNNDLATGNAFLEHHYYSGGLRTDFFSLGGGRPTWAPPSDWVGFRDEFALNSDEAVIEVVKFEFQENIVSWVGVYIPASDKVYGDRRNHAGFGVWLLNCFPKTPALLIDALQSLLHSASSDTQEKLSAKSRSLLTNYLGDYIERYEALSRPFGGLKNRQAQVGSYSICRIGYGNEIDEAKLDDLIFRLFFYLPQEEADNSRALILLSNSEDSRAKLCRGSSEASLARELLRQIPVALRVQSETINILRRRTEESKAALDDADLKCDQLQSEIVRLQSRAEEAERRAANLQKAIDEDDERQRFSLIQSGLADIGQDVSRAHGDISNLRREIIAEIRKIQSSYPSQSLGSGIRERALGGEQYPTKKTSRTWLNSDVAFYGILIFLFLLVTGLLVWKFAF